jgi:methionine-rich copper-binding protein CopC
MRRFLILLLLSAGILAFPAVALAHPGLIAAAPGPGQKVAPGFEAVALVFGPLRADATHQVRLSGPDEAEIPAGEVILIGEGTLCVAVQPTDQEGKYAIDYTIAGDDGDVVEGRYFFEVRRSNPRVAVPEDCAARLSALATSPPPAFWAGLAAVLLAVAAVAVIALRRRPEGGRRS